MAYFPIQYAEVDHLYHQTIAQGLGVIALSSITPQEGTTTLCQTLGERAARAGQKTLLMDLNIAHPQLHSLYDVAQTDWYPQQEDPYPVQKTAYANLSVLSAPLKSFHRWEFRDLAHILACLNDLRAHYEVILMDTSPLSLRNQGNIPPETLCTSADGTVLTILSGKTSESQIRDACDLLYSVNARLHGAVLNDRFAPKLRAELIRETYRLDKFLPRLMAKCRILLSNSTLLNQDI